MLLQTSGFSTGFANGHYKYTSAVSSASVGLQWLFELVCDDPGNYSADDASNTFSLLFRRKRPRKRVGKYWRWHLDTEMMK